jgi:glycosyltransferase EpsE
MNTNMIKQRISVLMGIYNCAATLDEALESLYAQTYREFKIILCDDGSTDNTYKVAQTHAKSHGNVVLIKNERNMGLNYTLNHCLEYADTEYCARMDGDDISLPTRFETEINFLDTHPEYDIVTTPMKYFDKSGVFRIGKGGTEPKLTDFPKYSPFCHAPCMVRKRAYDAVEGYTVDKRLLREEDYHLWIKMYVKGFRGYTLEYPLYMMRDDRNAASRRSLKARINEAYVKHLACKMLGLPFYYNLYCLKPLILGLMPLALYRFIYKLH